MLCHIKAHSSALNFDICGFTGVIFVVLNAKFKLVSFCTLIFAVFVKHICVSRYQFTNVNHHTGNEPEVVLAARWLPKEKITSPFDSPTPTLYRHSVEIFRLSLTVQKLFE